jgi:putative flippase GtrA
MMKKLLKLFFNRSFIIFCIIGVINTLVHLVVYNLLLKYDIILANTVAFIIASLFSYWANSTFTYKKKMNHNSFIASMITFLFKLFLSNGLTLLFEFIFVKLGMEDFIKLIPIPVTCIILPLQFLVFNRIFNPQNKNNNDSSSEQKS